VAAAVVWCVAFASSALASGAPHPDRLRRACLTPVLHMRRHVLTALVLRCAARRRAPRALQKRSGRLHGRRPPCCPEAGAAQSRSHQANAACSLRFFIPCWRFAAYLARRVGPVHLFADWHPPVVGRCRVHSSSRVPTCCACQARRLVACLPHCQCPAVCAHSLPLVPSSATLCRVGLAHGWHVSNLCACLLALATVWCACVGCWVSYPSCFRTHAASSPIASWHSTTAGASEHHPLAWPRS
jgi:hypothetical protein